MTSQLDPVIHAPTRLQIVSLLAAAEEAEFAFVRDSLDISDSVLSKHASALEAARYVKIRKGHVGKRPRTWFSLTPAGRKAYQNHVAALQGIVAQSGLSVVDVQSGQGWSADLLGEAMEKVVIDPHDVRASDQDRDKVAEMLRVAASDGRITMDELTERIERTYTSRTVGELAVIVADLGPTNVLSSTPIW
ncbi:transcriptional regulator [Acrocarpospora sp. B8E8]|uniref:transcriptional regulator n=1 Tax=Acrocarpospora sp. B8E8 TaxID=3153572 RepID=UPI00325C8D16